MDKSGELGLQEKVNTLCVSHPTLPHHKSFSEFSEHDMEEMKEFLLKLHDAADKHTENETSAINDAIALCDKGICLEGLNPALVKKALGIFLTHSSQAQKLGIMSPPLKVHKEAAPPCATKICPVTADTLTGYDVVSYFREDHDLNDHHWNWHKVYPVSGIHKNPDSKEKPTTVRALDRQGELFFYMHSQMLARYNAELVSWNLDIVHAWSYRDVATFSYTPPPLLRAPGTQMSYTVRPTHRGWRDEDPSISEMDKCRNNILKAIENETIITVTKKDGTPGEFKLTEKNAMNWIGMITEALSPDLLEVEPGVFVNRDLYGSLHNDGHGKFATIVNPILTNYHVGVMGDTASAVRDPVFWLWHRHIDDFRLAIIKKYKHDVADCKPEAKITGLKIVPQDASSKTPAGGITTILGPPQLELDESTAKIDHEPYKWEIEVESTQATAPTKAKPQTFTVRLFIVPKDFIRDERSWIEMDKFMYNLTDKTATITRLDTESSVARKTLKEGESASSQCRCGWPQNMMLPAGRPDGMAYIALAVLTKDKLEDGGTQSLSFCGSKNSVYPDHRGMGYPFDKKWDTSKLKDSVTHELDVANSKEMPHMSLYYFSIYRTTKNY